MFFMIKFGFYFTLSFLILSYPVNRKTFFDYLYDMTSPSTSGIYESIQEKTGEILKQTKSFGKSLFKNADPKHLDKINSSLSSAMRPKMNTSAPKKVTTTKKPSMAKPEDSYTREEKKLLEKILKEAQ